MKTEITWWSVVTEREGNRQQWICTLSDVGAHAAHGPFVDTPFTVEGPASAEDAEWANAQIDAAIAAKELEEETRERLESL